MADSAISNANFDDNVEGANVKSTGETGGVKYLREDGDGTSSWQPLSSPMNVQEFTASGTWTKPSSGTFAIIEIVGAGGSGGASYGTYAAAGGGGGGAYGNFQIPLSFLPASLTVTIAPGGVSKYFNTAGNKSDGESAGNTTFGSFVTAPGGAGGGSTTNDGTAVGGGSGGTIATAAVGLTINASAGGAGGGASTVSGGSFGNGTGSASGAGGGGGAVSDTGVGGGGTGGANSYGPSGDGGAGAGATTSGDMVAGNGGTYGGGGGGASTRFTPPSSARSGAGGNGYCKVTVV